MSNSLSPLILLLTLDQLRSEKKRFTHTQTPFHSPLKDHSPLVLETSLYH